MDNLLKSEVFKLKKDRSFKTLILILIAIAVLIPTIMFMFGTEPFRVDDLFTSIIGKNHYVLKLLPCLLAGYFISSEYSLGTMKSIASSGNSRIRIYIAKLLVFTFGAIILSVILPIAMIGFGAMFAQFNGMPDLKYFMQTMIFIILYAAAFSSIMMVFATLFTDSGKAIGVLFAIFLLFDPIMFVLASKFTVFEYIYDYSIFHLVYKIIMVNAMDSIEIFKLTIIPILVYLAFGILGVFVFLKKEIK
ncbi:ABC transporter permease [Bacillus paramycoides]|uniref:ABC transporter permease n=1 Tax=Bacillus paramycoides TaxID=2026194 RepID=UPI002E24B5D6|nr:ABC transporter permease [Bacillus paramycoides]MED1089370.1 ABC transporter permease [Bacillus paramycoides]